MKYLYGAVFCLIVLSLVLYFQVYAQSHKINDTVLVDKLAKYGKIPKVQLDNLYKKSSWVKYNKKQYRSKLSFNRPLFKKYPGLKKSLPHINLGDFPTPIMKLETLGKLIGCENLYVKRDDLAGKEVAQKNRKKAKGSQGFERAKSLEYSESFRLFGGNKIRKLEFLLADALRMGCTSIMTIGAAGSNHALATTVCAHSLGLQPISILGPQANNETVKRNLLLGKLYGADLQYCACWSQCPLAIANLYASMKEKDGVFPYYITLGGSSPLGVAGFVDAAFELKKQIDQGIMPEPDLIYVACGSMGTTAGLLLGLQAVGLKSKVIAVRVGDNTRKRRVISLFKETNNFLHAKDKSFPIFDSQHSNFSFEQNFFGHGYAQRTKAATEAIKLIKQHENIQLDITYAGKGFAAVIGHAREKLLQNKTVLFWNTFCGFDYEHLVSQVDYKTLPKNLHAYFEN